MKLPVLTTLLVSTLLLGGCALPQPFRHEGVAVPLARPQGVRGVGLRIPTIYQPQGGQLADALTKVLDEMEIPSSQRQGAGFSTTLSLSVEANNGTILLDWILIQPDGQSSRHSQRLTLAQWQQSDTALMKSLARDCITTLLPPLYGVGTDPQAAPDPAISRKQIRVRVTPLAGLPGDGDTSLTAAVKAALARGTVQITDDPTADYVIEGRVAVAPHRMGEDLITLHWQVKRAKDNKDLGAADQDGPVPAGRLSQPWGGLARDIADGGAVGIMEIILADQDAQAAKQP